MARLAQADPDPKAGLAVEDPFRLLVSVLLSAQSTGPTVARVSDALFAKAGTPDALLALGEDAILTIVRPVGLGPSKTRAILKLCAALASEFGGQVPRTPPSCSACRGSAGNPPRSRPTSPSGRR